VTDLEARVQDIVLQASDVVEVKDKVFFVNNNIVLEFVGMLWICSCFAHYVGNDEDVVEVSSNKDYMDELLQVLRKRDRITSAARKKNNIRELLGVDV